MGCTPVWWISRRTRGSSSCQGSVLHARTGPCQKFHDVRCPKFLTRRLAFLTVGDVKNFGHVGIGVMAFQAKSATALIGTLLIVYIPYFAFVGYILSSTSQDVANVAYKPLLILATVPVAIIAAV